MSTVQPSLQLSRYWPPWATLVTTQAPVPGPCTWKLWLGPELAQLAPRPPPPTSLGPRVVCGRPPGLPRPTENRFLRPDRNPCRKEVKMERCQQVKRSITKKSQSKVKSRSQEGSKYLWRGWSQTKDSHHGQACLQLHNLVVKTFLVKRLELSTR